MPTSAKGAASNPMQELGVETKHVPTSARGVDYYPMQSAVCLGSCLWEPFAAKSIFQTYVYIAYMHTRKYIYLTWAQARGLDPGPGPGAARSPLTN